MRGSNIPSPPSTSHSSSQKHKNRKWTREQLLKNLEILGPLSAAPLPPNLPPSPPASRSASPAPSTKRKLDHSQDAEHAKRPRTTLLPDRPAHLHQPPPPPPPQQQPQHHFRPPNPVFSMRSEPSEEGEVPEEIASASTSRGSPANVLTTLVPVRRPRRGRPEYRTFDQMHDKYHNFGRLLKYSGDARFWSTYPATHKEYRPLLNPPPPNSPYHKFGGLIARLELVDALVCFTYSIWSRDYGRRQCSRETWSTSEAFLEWCKHKWLPEDTVGDREKAFIGLIWMIEAFIKGRRQAYIAKVLDPEMGRMVLEINTLAAAAAAEVNKASAAGQLASGSTPPMLPSPASIAPANSANSTPINRADSTPSTAGSSSSSASVTRGQTSTSTSSASAPMSEAGAAAAASVTLPIGANTLLLVKESAASVVNATSCMGFSQQTLNLPIMARHFPTTFARMVHSSLGPSEEYEPDIEDEEGELFWPGQCITGEGIGWVCLMGKAMIKEFGKEIGYRGLDGVVPKPKPEQGPETPADTVAGSSMQGSVVHSER